MIADPKRLTRVARAQASLARSLELRLAEKERELHALERDRRDILALVDRDSTIALSVRTSALRRLVDMETAIAKARKSLADLRHEVLLSRGREKSIAGRVSTLEYALSRAAEQAEIQEALQLEAAKASHKHDVVE